MPAVATARLSPRRVRPGPLVLHFVSVLPYPHLLDLCSHMSVFTPALELLD